MLLSIDLKFNASFVSSSFVCSSTKECIPEDKRCDGMVNCKDGSDEFNDCKNIPWVFLNLNIAKAWNVKCVSSCPGFLFSCDYGACIDVDKKCDGQKDCRDNSDETNCIDTGKVNQKVGGNCKWAK